MSEELADLKLELFCMVNVSQEKYTVSSLLSAYRTEKGNFPFRELGYRTFLEYLLSIPDKITVSEPHSDKSWLYAVKSDKSGHITNLVNEQRSNKSKSRYKKNLVNPNTKETYPIPYSRNVRDDNVILLSTTQRFASDIVTENPGILLRDLYDELVHKYDLDIYTFDENLLISKLSHLMYCRKGRVYNKNTVMYQSPLPENRNVKPNSTRQIYRPRHSVHTNLYNRSSLVTSSERSFRKIKHNNTPNRTHFADNYVYSSSSSVTSSEQSIDNVCRKISSDIVSGTHARSNGTYKNSSSVVGSQQPVDNISRNIIPNVATGETHSRSNEVHTDSSLIADSLEPADSTCRQLTLNELVNEHCPNVKKLTLKQFFNRGNLYNSADLAIVPRNDIENFVKLLTKFENGIACQEFSSIYENEFKYNFDYKKYGFSTIFEMALKFPNIFQIKRCEDGHRLYLSGNELIDFDEYMQSIQICLVLAIQKYVNGISIDRLFHDIKVEISKNSIILENFGSIQIKSILLSLKSFIIIEEQPIFIDCTDNEYVYPKCTNCIGQKINKFSPIFCSHCMRGAFRSCISNSKLDENVTFKKNRVGDKLDVIITAIHPNGLLYCHLSNDNQKIQVLQKEMNSFYSSNLAICKIHGIIDFSGHLFACYYNRKWFRVQQIRLDVQQRKFLVHFVDYGFTKLVTRNSLYFLDKRFLGYYHFSFKLKLSNIEDKSFQNSVKHQNNSGIGNDYDDSVFSSEIDHIRLLICVKEIDEDCIVGELSD